MVTVDDKVVLRDVVHPQVDPGGRFIDAPHLGWPGTERRLTALTRPQQVRHTNEAGTVRDFFLGLEDVSLQHGRARVAGLTGPWDDISAAVDAYLRAVARYWEELTFEMPITLLIVPTPAVPLPAPSSFTVRGVVPNACFMNGERRPLVIHELRSTSRP